MLRHSAARPLAIWPAPARIRGPNASTAPLPAQANFRPVCTHAEELSARAPRGRGSSSSVATNKPSLLPEPAAYQQTLRRSFAVGGIGLHTGEYALVRVLPAFAGDGRYFVRMPPGTNSRHWALEQPQEQDLEEPGTPATHLAGGGEADLNAKLFFEFVQRQEDGSFSGTFADYLQRHALLSPETLFIDAEMELLQEEQPARGQLEEARLQAHVGNLQQGHRWCTILAQGSTAIWGAEHLLAALECCGVDDARIEIEGGQEIPIIDGSALGWAAEVQRTGLRPAFAATSSDALVPKSARSLHKEVTVRDGEAFITYYPGPVARVSGKSWMGLYMLHANLGVLEEVGVDCSAAAPVLGCQWFTWSPEGPGCRGNSHFRLALAPARTWYPSVETVKSLMDEGLLQGGPEYVSLIGDKDDWLDATMVRFPTDEAARHAIVDLLGDLSLLASSGGRGLPAGHIVAYQPTHDLQAKFVKSFALGLSGAAAS